MLHFNWSILDLKRCVNFCFTAKWFSYAYICVCLHCVCVYIHIHLFNLFFFWLHCAACGISSLTRDWIYILCNRSLDGVLNTGLPGGSHIFFFPLWFIIGYWIYFSALYSRNLSTQSIYSSFYLLTPVFTPLLPQFSQSWKPQVCSLCPWVCFCFIHVFICVIS